MKLAKLDGEHAAAVTLEIRAAEIADGNELSTTSNEWDGWRAYPGNLEHGFVDPTTTSARQWHAGWLAREIYVARRADAVQAVQASLVVVCETAAAITTHLRHVTDEHPINLNGRSTPAFPFTLCGQRSSWDTHAPIAAVRCRSCIAVREYQATCKEEKRL